MIIVISKYRVNLMFRTGFRLEFNQMFNQVNEFSYF